MHEDVDLSGTEIVPAVTVRHLSTHTSAIADITEEDEGRQCAEVVRVVPCHTIETTRDSLPRVVLPLVVVSAVVVLAGDGCASTARVRSRSESAT